MTVCHQCGTQNQEDVKVCANCQASLETIPATSDKKSGLLPVGNVLMGLVCIIYLLNPGAGIIELIPDNIPLIGNLDEGAAVVGLLMAANNLGIINFKAEDWTEILPWLTGDKSNQT